MLEALLQSCSLLAGSHPRELATEKGGEPEEKLLAPQMSFKARSGTLQYSMGFMVGSASASQGVPTIQD